MCVVYGSNNRILKEELPGSVGAQYATGDQWRKTPERMKGWSQSKNNTQLWMWLVIDEMAGWHHWLDGHEFEWTPGVGDGQGGLACCDSWGCKELDTTERLNWTELNPSIAEAGGLSTMNLGVCPGIGLPFLLCSIDLFEYPCVSTALHDYYRFF